MLQLATREVCLLVRIGQMGRPLPPTLRALLAAEAPVKVTLTLTLTLTRTRTRTRTRSRTRTRTLALTRCEGC